MDALYVFLTPKKLFWGRKTRKPVNCQPHLEMSAQFVSFKKHKPILKGKSMMSPTLSLPGKSLQFKKIGDHSPATLLLIGIGSLLLALGMFWVVNNMARSIYADHRLGSQPHHILENAHVEGECQNQIADSFELRRYHP